MEHRCYAANLNHPADVHADRPAPYGTLILSRFPIRGCTTTPLPRTGENEQRGLTVGGDGPLEGVPLQFYNTHLHTTAADRLLQTAARSPRPSMRPLPGGRGSWSATSTRGPTAPETRKPTPCTRSTVPWAKAGVTHHRQSERPGRHPRNTASEPPEPHRLRPRIRAGDHCRGVPSRSMRGRSTWHPTTIQPSSTSR